MMLFNLLPLATILVSFVLGLVIFGLPEKQVRLRTTLNIVGAVAKLGLVAWMLYLVDKGYALETRYRLVGDLELLFRADLLALYFAMLSILLWLLTTIYAIGYLANSENRSRFFGFFSICTSVTVGVALAGNLFTFIIMYEMLSLSTYPLIVHSETEKARRAGKVYLKYALSGGALLMFGAVWLYTLSGTLEFIPKGFVAELYNEHTTSLILIFFLLIAGLGVKAALFPLHGWLPKAMVAPAPVSALLHAVAVVKAGAFGIIRVIYEVYGVEFASTLGVSLPLAYLAAFTIIYGSIMALLQTDLKKRLAFSTVSQISYIILGAALAGPIATIGGLVHLVHQGLMKITLFFCAGILAETLGIHDVKDMDGIGKRMPWTSIAFTIAAFGLIGLPPLAGFVSKWYLSLGALEIGHTWVLLLLVLSSLLNALYFLPLVHRAWFKPPSARWQEAKPQGKGETDILLLSPTLISASLVILAGLLASTSFSPFAWTIEIVAQEFMRNG